MNDLVKEITDLVSNELSIIWAAHENAGLSGYMCLYTNEEQIPFRAKEGGLKFWFDKEGSTEVIAKIFEYYNNGRLPNSPLLLNPIVHRKEADESYTPLGSGISWCNALCLGIDVLNDLSAERLTSIGAFVSNFSRGDNPRAGIKALIFCDSILPPAADGKSTESCIKLFEIADINSEKYATSYFLSGIGYLTNNGMFKHQSIADSFPANEIINGEFIKKHAVNIQTIYDAAECWNAYERHHSLYTKFGTNTKNIERNLKFFNMVARDVALFDATGPAKKEEGEGKSDFEFVVPGYLVRGAVTLLVAGGGTGRSSVAHRLCTAASADYAEGEKIPDLFGQTLDTKNCRGINIYFAGEDSPQIFNARAAIIDPDRRAERLLFQRVDFGENVSFAQHLRNLQKLPDVPLMIIDPAKKYIGGDENDNNLVNVFFDALEEFAVEKNTAVVVVHQLQRGATPKSIAEFTDIMSGSQAFIERPRVIIGMYREGPYTVVGLSKNNIPPNLGMVSEERVFARVAKDLSLAWLPGKDGVRNANLSEAELAEIAKQPHEH